MHDVRNVLVFGAIGGALTWIAGHFWFDNDPHFSVWIDPFVSTALGAGAGLVYVFLLANTDRSDAPRLLALAFLAGFSWEPVLQGASALLEQNRDYRTIAQAEAAAQEAIRLVKEVKTAPAEERDALLEAVVQKTSETEVLSGQIRSVFGLNKISATRWQIAQELETLPPDLAKDPLDALRSPTGGGPGGGGVLFRGPYPIAAPED